MKVEIIKDWHFHHIGGKQILKKGSIEHGKYLPGKGLHIAHFYGYGADEIIPEDYIKIIDKRSKR